MSISWRAVSAVLDSGTAVCAGLNSLYFAVRLLSGSERSSSRLTALGVLWLAALAVLIESVALLAMAGLESKPFATPSWTAVRALTFVATTAVSALICRRLATR